MSKKSYKNDETSKLYYEILEVFDDKKYAKLAYDNNKIYTDNEPFPHIVLDEFLPQSIADTLANEYPTIDNQNTEFKFHSHENASRHFLDDARYFSRNFKLFSSALSSRSFLLFLEVLTGNKSLIPDPYYIGGGAMMTEKGGFLNIHVDFNWHQRLQAWRRCNILFYFTKDWKKEYKGNLELWTTDGKSKVKEIEPLFNRVVIFDTTNESYHGQPTKINTPENICRNVFSAFYYASTKNEKTDAIPHYTKYNAVENRKENEVALLNTSPYAESIINNYLKDLKK
tara:strand:- start:194 stop:1045 length:852 start_codon:yes stop_codon:yes gene_type:complete